MAGSVKTGTKKRPGSQKVMPPEKGWRLHEALEALCPDEVRLYRRAGADLTAAVETDLNRLCVPAIPVPENRVEVWLTRRLLAVLNERTDLLLAGQKDDWAPREPVPRKVIESALRTVEEAAITGRWWIICDFQSDVTFIRRYLPDGSWAPVLPHDLHDMRVVAVSKPHYTYARGVVFYKSLLQERGDLPPLTEEEVVAAFTDHFSNPPGRDVIRQIRQTNTPAPGLKRGPRGPRN